MARRPVRPPDRLVAELYGQGPRPERPVCCRCGRAFDTAQARDDHAAWSGFSRGHGGPTLPGTFEAPPLVPARGRAEPRQRRPWPFLPRPEVPRAWTRQGQGAPSTPRASVLLPSVPTTVRLASEVAPADRGPVLLHVRTERLVRVMALAMTWGVPGRWIEVRERAGPVYLVSAGQVRANIGKPRRSSPTIARIDSTPVIVSRPTQYSGN